MNSTAVVAGSQVNLYADCAFDVTDEREITAMMHHWRQKFASLCKQGLKPRAKVVKIDGREYRILYRNGGKTWLYDGSNVIVTYWSTTRAGCQKGAWRVVNEWDCPNSDRFKHNLEKAREGVAS